MTSDGWTGYCERQRRSWIEHCEQQSNGWEAHCKQQSRLWRRHSWLMFLIGYLAGVFGTCSYLHTWP
jgi:hypothetical protein